MQLQVCPSDSITHKRPNTRYINIYTYYNLGQCLREGNLLLYILLQTLSFNYKSDVTQFNYVLHIAQYSYSPSKLRGQTSDFILDAY